MQLAFTSWLFVTFRGTDECTCIELLIQILLDFYKR